MAFTDALVSRWDGNAELPDRLENLRGPVEGTVVLPVHMTWYGLREFDVSEDEQRLVLYSIVLSQGRRGDMVRFVNGWRLRGDWPRLRTMVTSRLRGACERKLGLGDMALGSPRAAPSREPAVTPDPRRPGRTSERRLRARFRLCQGGCMRKYVIMGVQGSGKGTQSDMLAADLDLVHISVGDIFRWHVQNHTKMGAQVWRIMAAGELVGDDMAESVVRERLAQHDWNYGFIIDGFPRNRRQAEFFLESYDIDGVIHLDLPDSEVRRRVLARRLCAKCGMDYNLIANSPAVPGKCDACGGDLVTREDDTEEALAVRLRDYHEKTNPVLDLFRRKEYVITVDARPSRVVVQQGIRGKLGLPPAAGQSARDDSAQG